MPSILRLRVAFRNRGRISCRTALATGAFLLGCAAAAGCPAFTPAPCFPTSAATPLAESEGGFSRRTLAWEIDKMAALADAPERDEPPSEIFARAQRDMRTEFWMDAAKGFLSVVRGDTSDGKKLRLLAQYDLGLSLFRLRYFDEARRIFAMIADDRRHPMSAAATDWMLRKVCSE